MTNDDLSDFERAVLTVESKWWQYAGAKEQAIKDATGLTLARWYQKVNAWIDTERAMQIDPLLTKRLLRRREVRQRRPHHGVWA